MNRCKNIVTNHALGDNNSVLIVVALPRNVSYHQVATESQLTIFRGITFGKDVACFHTLTLVANRTKVDSHILIGAAELRNAIFLQGRLKADKLFLLCTIIENTNGSSVNIFDNTITLGSNHGTRILAHLAFQAGSYNRSVIVEQRYSLAHHVTRSEEHTSELQSRQYLVCRLLLEKKKNNTNQRKSLS